MGVQGVVYHDGPLDPYLDAEIRTAVILPYSAHPDITGSTAIRGTENGSPSSPNLSSLVNVDENSLAHNPNGRVSQRIARGLRHFIGAVMVQDYVHDVGRGENDDISQAIVKQHPEDRGHFADTTSGLDQKERRESDYSEIENRGEEIKHPLGYESVLFPW